MTLLTRRLRRIPPDQPGVDQTSIEAEHEDEPGRLQAHWTGGSALATRAVTFGLWAALVTGPLALLLAAWVVLGAAAPPVVQRASGLEPAGERAAVQAFAEHYVLTWLQTPAGEEEQLQQFVSASLTPTLPKTPWSVSQPAVADIAGLEDSTWSVTVAVTVTPPGKDPTVAARRYFQVPVTYQEGRLLAQTLPAPVAAPQPAEPVELDYPYRADHDDAPALAARDFLAALLTRAGDVTRYLSPGTSVAPIDPPPYATVEVQEVLVDTDLTNAPTTPRQGEQLQLLVTATAAADAEHEISVQYALTLAARAGRWEVKAIDPAPTREPTTPTAVPPASTAPTSSPSTT
jgi:hypothetical protein